MKSLGRYWKPGRKSSPYIPALKDEALRRHQVRSLPGAADGLSRLITYPRFKNICK
jgi:hypothetical protein